MGGLLSASIQKIMVDNARYFYNKIVSNSLPELPMNSSAVANRGLLGHSIGAGLATYVAKQAALHGKPFKAVMYMAPQISVSAALCLSEVNVIGMAYVQITSMRKSPGTGANCTLRPTHAWSDLGEVDVVPQEKQPAYFV